jgi:hypothetical protein
MDNRFQGLVVFLIGLSVLLVAYTISQAETTTTIETGLGPRTAISGLSAPIAILWIFGAILAIAGIIWGTVGDKLDVSVRWK